MSSDVILDYLQADALFEVINSNLKASLAPASPFKAEHHIYRPSLASAPSSEAEAELNPDILALTHPSTLSFPAAVLHQLQA